MTNFMLMVLLNVSLTTLCVLTYLFNYAVLKLKSEYRGFKWQILIVLTAAPGFNALFLLFNILLLATHLSGYRVVKVKRSKKRVPSRA